LRPAGIEALNEKDVKHGAGYKKHALTKVSARFVGGDSPLEALNEKDVIITRA